MNSYIIHFATYTFAMIGFIGLILFIYKKSMYYSSFSQDKEFLKVENTMRLSAGKTIYVIKAGKERFLIAGDCANTTMLAKLDADNKSDYIVNTPIKSERLSTISAIKKMAQNINRG